MADNNNNNNNNNNNSDSDSELEEGDGTISTYGLHTSCHLVTVTPAGKYHCRVCEKIGWPTPIARAPARGQRGNDNRENNDVAIPEHLRDVPSELYDVTKFVYIKDANWEFNSTNTETLLLHMCHHHLAVRTKDSLTKTGKKKVTGYFLKDRCQLFIGTFPVPGTKSKYQQPSIRDIVTAPVALREFLDYVAENNLSFRSVE